MILPTDEPQDGQAHAVPRGINLGDTKLAYIAGLFDAEAAFMIDRKKSGPAALRLTYKKTKRQILEYLAGVFGGKVRSVEKERGQRHEVWEWAVSSRLAYEAMVMLHPFLRIKKEAAAICINYYKRTALSEREPLNTRKAIAEEYSLLLRPYQKKSVISD